MKQRIFYGWIVVAAGVGIMATAIGIVNNCFGLLIVPICEELGFSRQAMAGNQTMLNMGAMLTAMLSGRIFKQKNLKRLMCIGSVLMCGLYFLLGVVRSLYAFYLVSLLVGLAQGMINTMPFSILLSNWFHEKRGLALGLTYMGSGLGGMAFNFLGGRIIERMGWQRMVFVYGLILCAVVLPLVFFVIKASPSDKGLLPYGEKSINPIPVTPRPIGKLDRPPLRNWKFYIIGVDMIVSGLAVNSIAATSTPYYTDIFSSGVMGANLASIFMASLAAGKLILGALYDRFSAFKATILARIMLVFSLSFLALGKETIYIVLHLLSAGVAAASISVSTPFIARAVVPGASVVSVMGIYAALQSFGALVAPIFCGRIRDYTGSYAYAYWFLCACVALILPATLKALKTRRAKICVND